MTLRALVVDDEPFARARVCDLLAAEAEVEVVGEARDGLEAVAAIRRERPDIVFLDVQMPELDGFGVLEALAGEKLPVVIFTTAYDQYALKAFEVQALDYLLKPIDPDRFQQALQRARSQVGRDDALRAELLELLQSLPNRPKFLERLVVKAGGRISFLRADEADCFEACGNYIRLCLGSEEHLVRMTMAVLETRLDPHRFLRIHRSTIVNVERVRELQSTFHGEYVVLLRNGRRLTLSRGYREKLQQILDSAS
jgi:two-component system, LytTR family, response regulator